MSEVTTRPAARATKATPGPKTAPAHVSKPARPALTEDDHRAIAIGSLIYNLLMPITDGPSGSDRVTGFNHISDAESHAWDLHRAGSEWTEEGQPPTVCDLVLLIHSHLHLAMAEIVASKDTSNTPLMYCVRLLVGEALRISQDLQEAYIGLPATSAALAALTKFQQPEATVSDDERTIANTGAMLLGQAASRIADENGPAYPVTLLEFGQKILRQVACGQPMQGGIQDAFFYAAGACTGALAIEQRERPSATESHQLIMEAYEVLNNAGLGYDLILNANDVAAAAIKAGARKFSDRPTPPIRRIEDPEPRSKGYSHAQMKSAFEFVASAADNVRNILMMAQTADEDWEVRRLVDAAELMVRHIGASADVAVGVNVIGDLEHWNYGPNFRKAGDAA